MIQGWRRFAKYYTQMEGTLYLPLNQIKYNQLVTAFTQNWQSFEWRTRVVAEMSRYPLLLGQATTTVVQRLQQIDFEYAASYRAPPQPLTNQQRGSTEQPMSIGALDERRCFKCQKTGHLKQDCRMGAQGQRSAPPGRGGGGGRGRGKGRAPPQVLEMHSTGPCAR